MSFEPVRRLSRKTSFRLTFWYTSVFILSALALFFLTYLLLSQSILEKDRRIALTKIRQYTRIEKEKGLNGLLAVIEKDRQSNLQNGFYIRVSDAGNRTLLQTIPPGLTAVDPRRLENARLSGSQKIIKLNLSQGGLNVEMRSMVLSPDVLLQVGFGLGERERLLEHFQRIFFLFSIPMILLAVLGGFFFAHRALRPVRDLILGLHSVDAGNLGARVPERQTGDELDELVHLFNALLAKIETLVNGMREALANVAHDLRTPVTRLRVSVESMIGEDSDADSLREALMDCAEESERIVTILNTLMDISEAETGAMHLDLEEVNLTEVLRDVLELYQYVAEDKGTHIEDRLPDTLVATSDRNRLRQALANLVDNAIKYTPAGGSVVLDGASEDQKTIIRVQDNGQGISEEDLPRIFDRLYRGDKSRGQRGLGLGLSLVQAVIHAHQGRIEVRSRPGQGATFTVILPRNAAES